MSELAVGDKAPDFDLLTGDGARVRLSRLKGKKVVLYFYPKDDSEACTVEALGFDGLQPKFRAAGAEIIGVSPDSPVSHQKFKAKHDLSLTLAADEVAATIRAYGAWREKQMFGRKFMGVERTTLLIDRSGKIARIWRKVRTPGHAEEVLQAAKSLVE
ncbi:MAG TPA: peroxiredoxin [Roseiarcus sp.]|nr:peroxiredoxin [Roseiarcus sp.]